MIFFKSSLQRYTSSEHFIEIVSPFIPFSIQACNNELQSASIFHQILPSGKTIICPDRLLFGNAFLIGTAYVVYNLASNCVVLKKRLEGLNSFTMISRW